MLAALLAAASLLAAPRARADDPPAPPPPAPESGVPPAAEGAAADPPVGDAEEAEDADVAEPFDGTLAGDPFGLRGRAAAAGVRVEASLIADWFRVHRGGLEPRRSLRHVYGALRAILDGDALVGVPGLSATVEAQFLGGNSRAWFAGTVQRPSAYAASDRTQWGLVYAEWTPADAPFRAQVGKIDPSWEFAVTDNGWEFLAADPVYAPNWIGVPVFPDSAVGAALHWEPEEGAYGRAAILDGAVNEGERTGRQWGDTLFGPPSDLAAVAEAGWRWTAEGRGAGRIGVGSWRHVGTATRRDGTGRDHGAGGWYATVDLGVWRPDGAGEEDARGISLFARWTRATTSVATEPYHAGGGVVWTGPLPGRPDDALQAAIFRTRTASDPAGVRSGGAERLVEVGYVVRLSPWLSVTPGVQWYTHPGGDRSLRDAVLFGVRVQVEF